jgi:hypothetical protein
MAAGVSGAASAASAASAATFTSFATAPLPSVNRARAGLQPAQYAYFIIEHCLAYGPAARSMTSDQVIQHIKFHFPLAPPMDKASKPLAQIMALLQGTNSDQVERDRIQIDLLQCIAWKARERGHYVSLIVVDAEYMVARAWENLRSEYVRLMKRKWEKRFHPQIPAFDKSRCTPPEFDADKSYVIGWFFVASYMRDLRKLMIPVSALDAAHMKFPAQGTMYAEVTKDVLDRLHPVAQMVFLGAENVPGYTLFTKEQHAAYGSSINLDPAGSDGCVIGDAARALRTQFEPGTSATTGGGTLAPRAATYKACAVHQKRSMTAHQTHIFDSLRKMPPSHKLKVRPHMYSNLLHVLESSTSHALTLLSSHCSYSLMSSCAHYNSKTRLLTPSSCSIQCQHGRTHTPLHPTMPLIATTSPRSGTI